MDNNKFFEIVPEDYSDEAVEVRLSEVPVEFIEQARQDGFGETSIERAISEYAGSSYEDFVESIVDSISAIEDEKEKEAIKRNAIRRSIKVELERLESSDVFAEIDKLISNVYETTAVSAIELVDECSKSFSRASEDLYQECKYAVCLCIKSEWVRSSIATCLDRWDSSMEVKKYITQYLKKQGYEPENYNSGIRKIIEFLPESIKNEKSPLMYKAFRSTQLSIHGNSTVSDELANKVLSDSTYYAALADCKERSIPLIAAEQIATGISVKKNNIIDSAGLLYGRAVSMKYKLANSFDDAVRESLGDNADRFYVEREINKRKKEQVKLEKDLQKSSERSKEISDSVVVSSQYRPRITERHVDVNPHVPKWAMSLLGGLVVSILMLLLGKFSFALMFLFTSVATYGWFCYENQKRISNKSPLLFIIGGYFCAVLLLFTKLL